jgi:membrane-associated phospholipid phosphatase
MISTVIALDILIENFIYTIRVPFWNSVFSFLTQLGDARWITVVALSMAFVLWRHRRFAYKAGLAVALFGSLFASEVIKLLVQRARPDAALALIHETGYSFPSMHATVSLAIYGFLAYMVWKLMHPPHHRLPWVIFLCVLIALIGFSRIYLGVHYFSDVLGGYVVGGIFLWLGILTTKRLNGLRNDRR